MEDTNHQPASASAVASTDSTHDVEEEFGKNKRKKTSKVWDEFNEVEALDGTKKVECAHCKKKMASQSTGCTSHLKRHLLTCKRRPASMNKQATLKLQPIGESVDSSFDDSLRLGFEVAGRKYDQGKMRAFAARWVLAREHPFTIVEEDELIDMCTYLNPSYEKISRRQSRSDCMELYESEKNKLKNMLKKVNKISLTTDCWKSSHQRVEYMVITGHFIDSSWTLQKRVLSFVTVPPPRRGVDIADAIFKCLKEWSIENKVFSVTVDNASYNDSCLITLKDNFMKTRKLTCDGKLFHVRCCAHILNILVQDGLKEIEFIIDSIRESVKYLRKSEARLMLFAEIANQLQIKSKSLMLDCSTRWNSTYDMLSRALEFKDVFPMFSERDPSFVYLPSDEDWKKVEVICEILEAFNSATGVVSGTDYPTSNLYLFEVCFIKEKLDKKANASEDFIRRMVKSMKFKFDKYWGEVNLLMIIAAVLDPRSKLKVVNLALKSIYPPEELDWKLEEVKTMLYVVFNEYVELEEQDSANKNDEILENVHKESSSRSIKSSGMRKFDELVRMVDSTPPTTKSELDMYLEEGLYSYTRDDTPFDALEWWKVNGLKFRVLSKMAADILAIPISSVASEATFSAGGRVIDEYRSSLHAETVQAIICGGDWLRNLRKSKKQKKPEKSETEVIVLPTI